MSRLEPAQTQRCLKWYTTVTATIFDKEEMLSDCHIQASGVVLPSGYTLSCGFDVQMQFQRTNLVDNHRLLAQEW